MTERQIDYLLNPGSTVLLSTPSYALHIAERLKQRGISPEDIPLRIGCFGGEGVPKSRQRGRKSKRDWALKRSILRPCRDRPTVASECSEKAGFIG